MSSVPTLHIPFGFASPALSVILQIPKEVILYGQKPGIRHPVPPSSKSSSKQDKENNGKNDAPGKSKSDKSKSDIIVLDDEDSDAGAPNGHDSEVEDVSEMTVLQTKIKQNRRSASSIRLTPKTELDTLPARTSEFLKSREASRKRDQSKTSSVLFKVSLFLQKDNGRKIGTRVPLQSRSFQLDESMEHALSKLVDMFNESDGMWAKEYPGKKFTFSDVQFTFTATIPVELTLDPLPSEDSDVDLFDEILSTKKKRRKLSQKSGPKKKKVKKEEDNDSFAIKDEPAENEMPKANSGVPRVLHLTSPVVFTKQVYSNSLDEVSEGTEFHGFRDLCSKSTPLLGTYFQLSSNGEQYLARRLESAHFQFSPDSELAAARAELSQAHQLKVLLDELTGKYGVDVPELFRKYFLTNSSQS
ncbi:hypothetical protein DFH07DRAFT_1056322 [Mycena maculata]|uniref:Uncharacterized protein n=1 Tax=Mycena maculata TaxID=230809 RepID=A0AAD7K4C6_9AGAR|nr:hypothetical protein DFH07DRAFT_1056322 [Mycena maculata]